MFKQSRNSKPKSKKIILALFIFIVLSALSIGIFWLFFKPLTVEERIQKYAEYDETISVAEKLRLEDFIILNKIQLNSKLSISSNIDESVSDANKVNGIFVPVVDFYSVKQNISNNELAETKIVFDENIEQNNLNQITKLLNIENDQISENIEEDSISIISVDSLESGLKLLSLNDKYYLDELDSGAFFREISIVGEDSPSLSKLVFNESIMIAKDRVYKTNITGVTALTRVMIRKLAEVNDPKFFSEKIGDFLADADLTHVSNEVSFKPGCSFAESSVMLFCSPPEFIETLKASGVDLVELTGNHNNDFGHELNKENIELYRSLGIGTVGGGLNNEDAAKPFLTDAKGTKLAFLAYNYPDSPNGGAISGISRAGANGFDFVKIEADIIAAKQQADFVTVNVQYFECYSYPEGYVEFPQCDKPIGQQEADFKKIVDLGADMVVGSSAHQPQTFEIYNGKPIYYGLGNLYFDQTNWPGTQRSLVLSNYFINGKLIQTKITPTVYGDDLQTRIMTPVESEFLLSRLKQAR